MKKILLALISIVFIHSMNASAQGGTDCMSATIVQPNQNQVDHMAGTVDQWYFFYAVNDGQIEITLFNEQYASVEVYEGFDCGNKVLVGSDDGLGDMQIDLKVPTTANNTYYIVFYYDPMLTNIYSFDFNAGTGPAGGGLDCTNAPYLGPGIHPVDHDAGMNDQWYIFDAMTDGEVTITANGYMELDATVYKGFDCPSKTEVISDNGMSDSKISMTFNAIMGDRYYILFRPSSSLPPYSFELIGGSGNSNGGIDCNSAPLVGPGMHPVDHINEPYIWYSINTPVADTLLINATSMDPELDVYTDCPETSSILTGYPGDMDVELITQPGMTYYLRFYDHMNNAMYYDINIQPKNGGGQTDGCVNAVSVSTGTHTADHTGGVDQWFKFNPAKDAEYRIYNCDDATTEPTMVNIYKGQDCMSKGQDFPMMDWCDGNKVSVKTWGFPGETIYIEWLGSNQGYASGSYDFKIEEVVPEPGSTCDNAEVISSGTHTADHGNMQYDKWYSYTTSQDALVTVEQSGSMSTSFEIINNCMNWNILAQDFDMDGTINVSYLAKAGETILLHWMNSMEDTYDFTITESTSFPEGIACNNAFQISDGTHTADHSDGYDKWYVYNAPEGGLLTVSNCADMTTEDTKIELYVGTSCMDKHMMNSNDDFCDLKSQISVEAYPNDNIYIKWSGPGKGVTGSYDFTVSLEPFPPGMRCENPKIAQSGTNTAEHLNGAYEEWFEFTVPEDGLVMVEALTPPTDAGLEIMKGPDCYMGMPLGYDDSYNDGVLSLGVPSKQGDVLLLRFNNNQMNGSPYDFTISTGGNIPPGISCEFPMDAVKGTNTADNQGGTIDQWFVYTPAESAILKATSCATTTENTEVEMFTGDNCQFLQWRASGFQNCGGGQSEASFVASAGETVYIKWSKYSGAGQFDWELIVDANIPEGVTCGSPIVASVGSNAVDHQGFEDAWYEFTPATTGYVSVNTCGETKNTMAEVYNSCDDFANYNWIAWGDNECGEQTDLLLSVTAGEPIFIRWLDWEKQGIYNFTIDEITDLPEGVICDNPIVADSGLNFSDHSDGATRKWYQYTATVNGKLTISANSTNGNYWMEAFKGGCPNNGGEWLNSNGYSMETFVGTGEVVYFAWESWNATSFNFNIKETVQAIPEGLSCSNPLTAQEGKNFTDLMNGSKWYSFTAPKTGTIEISSCQNNWVDTHFEVFDACGNEPVTFGGKCGMGSVGELDVVKGQEYFIVWRNIMSMQFEWTIKYLFEVTLELSATTTDASCGQNNGAATVTITGGTSPYDIQWSNGSTEATAEDLEAGIYQVNVTDAAGIQSFLSVTINNTSSLNISQIVQNIACKGESTGSIDITVTGGSTPYKYEWSNGAKTQDISGLVAGPYEVIVTDASGCSKIKSINITEPTGIKISFDKTQPSCGNSDGSIKANVTGGTSPYTYLWASGKTSQTINSLSAGSYTLTVTDDNSCDKSASSQINDKGAPTVVIDSVNESSCGSSDADIYVTASGGTGSFTYAWSDSTKTADLINVGPGTYTLTVTDDGNSCKAITSAVIDGSTPAPAEICIVTVDSATGFNQLMWAQDTTGAVSHYNIYKETSAAGVYNFVASVPATEYSYYIDTVANPKQRAWRYKISVVDECDNESELSAYHKTLHLTINYGAFGDEVNLIWDGYEGFTFGSYYIYRYTDANGWEQLDAIPSTLSSYTDLTFTDDTRQYYVAVDKGSDCLATQGGKKANAGPFSRSLSNLEDNRLQGTNSILEESMDIRVYPNPTTSVINVDLSGTVENVLSVSVIDVTGKLLLEQPAAGEKMSIDMGAFDAGMYLLKISSSEKESMVRFIKQ